VCRRKQRRPRRHNQFGSCCCVAPPGNWCSKRGSVRVRRRRHRSSAGPCLAAADVAEEDNSRQHPAQHKHVLQAPLQRQTASSRTRMTVWLQPGRMLQSHAQFGLTSMSVNVRRVAMRLPRTLLPEGITLGSVHLVANQLRQWYPLPPQQAEEAVEANNSKFTVHKAPINEVALQKLA
jgi:hypothetical protein